MKKIKLTRDMAALVDDEDYEQLNKYKWHISGRKVCNIFYAYAARHSRGKNRKYIRMERQILDLRFGDKKIADYINKNGLDNRKSNLRIVTTSQNQMDRKTQKHSSQYKGVSLRKDIRKWQVKIKKNGWLHHLGHFVNEIDAAYAYDEAAIKLFGKYARLNFEDE